MNSTVDGNNTNISYNGTPFAVFEKIDLTCNHKYKDHVFGKCGVTNWALFNEVDPRGKILLKFSVFLTVGNFECDVIIGSSEAVDILTQFFSDCFLEENNRSCDNTLTIGKLIVNFKINGITQCIYAMTNTNV